MTTKDKKSLALELFHVAGNLAEFKNDLCPELAHLSSEEIAEQLATWLRKIPHDYYDTRLPF